MPILVVEYDPKWPELFEFLRRRIAAALGEMAVAIEHVGSTSVPGLAAKPVIDMDVLLASDRFLNRAIEQLAPLGYRHEGDLGIAGREAFKAPAGDPRHHLYLCLPECREFTRHLAFRDFLRANPSEAKEYGELKKALAITFREDREAYVAGKSEFITRLTNRALAEVR